MTAIPGLRVGSFPTTPIGTPTHYLINDQLTTSRESPDEHPDQRERSDTLLGGQLDDGSYDHRLIDEQTYEHSPPEAPPGEGEQKLTARQILTLIILLSGNVSSSMFYSLLAPFFPTEATRKVATLYEVGIIFGSFCLIQFIMSPIFGNNMAKLGSKYLFVSGNFVCSGCGILFGMLQWCPDGRIYVAMCLILRSVEAVGAAAQTTATFTIGSYTFPKHISTVMGLLQASSCVGLVAGPPVGGILYAEGGFHLPFVVLGSIFMFFSLASFFFLPSPQHEAGRPRGGLRTSLQLLKSPMVLIVGYMVMVGQFTMGFIDVALAEYLDVIKPGISTITVGLIFLVPAVLVVIIAPLVGLLNDRYKQLGQPLLVFGGIVGAVSFLGVGPCPLLTFLPKTSVNSVIVSLVISALGWGALVVTYQQFVTAAKQNGLPEGLETQGIISGINGAFNSLGALLGPTIGGVMYEKIGFPWASTVVAGSLMLGGVLMLFYTVIEWMCCTPTLSISSGDVTNTTVQDINSADDEPLLNA